LEKIFLSAEIPESTPIPAPVQISKASAFLMQSAAARIDRLEAGAELIATPFFGSFGRDLGQVSARENSCKHQDHQEMPVSPSIWRYPNL